MSWREGKLRHQTWLAVLIGVSLFCRAAMAASPALTSVLPRGGQRGTEVELTLEGDRLGDAQEVFLYQPGLTVKKLQPTTKQVKAQVAIAPDAPIGEHALRVRTPSGTSELRTFWVGALPSVEEKEPNTDPARPQKIDLNVTVAGTIENEDIDHFAVELKKGQRLTAEMEAMRLGGGVMFDAHIAILDAKRDELAVVDDSALLLQDPVASIVVSADGTYIIRVRDSAYGGGAAARYRLHVGTFPRPRAVYPAGGRAEEELAVQFVGDVAGPIAATLKLPAETGEHRAFAERDGQVAPSPNVLRVSPFANVPEQEPNHDASTATPAGEVPVAINGVIAAPGDGDFFKINAKKDQAFDINVYARRLRSPLDSVLAIYEAAGKAVASNDDSKGPDSYVRFTAPADGEYTIAVNDQLLAGGVDYVYRIEVVPVTPQLTLAIPTVAANSQERQTIVVPRGNRFATLVRATRADFGGDVIVRVDGLPTGVTMHADPVAEGLDVIPVVFEAAADAPIAGALCDVVGKPVDEKVQASSTFAQTADLVVFGNQVAYYQANVSKLAVAVAEEAPFKLNIVPPKVPLVQGGSMQLKVVAERKEGFKGAITLAIPFNPPGVSSGGATIAEGETEAVVSINASGDAQVRKSKICVLGSADVNGPLWVSTQLAEIEVAPPFVGGKIEMASVEQGKAAQVLCTLEQKAPFEGRATVQLIGLPPNTSAEPKEITAADDKVIFDVKTDAKSPVGQHKTLFCAVTITKSGEPIAHSIAGGGVLRIDAPPAAPAVASATPAVAAPPTTAPAKPMSRLQKLRMEQAARSAKP